MFSKAYCIIFHTNCDINIGSITVKSKKSIPTLPTLEREGYHFIGWFKEEELLNPFDLDVMPKNDLDLYAKWEPITLEEFLNDINYFTKSANILKSLQNDYTDVPDFKDPKAEDDKPKKKKSTKSKSKKSTAKKTKKKVAPKKKDECEDKKQEKQEEEEK